MKDDAYRPHKPTGGGIPGGYKFMVCPTRGKRGVSSRVISPKLIRKVCRFCNWMES